MYGLFGTLTVESDKPLATAAEATVEDDVLADAAFMEAVEITNESDQLARDMQQGVAIAERLERQSALCAELGDNPDQITSGVAAMTRESMALAMVALGSVSDEYTVSNESILDAPVQALEVTNEGLKDTAKKIYASIKMAFQKIANNIKKLAAKIVVVMDNTGKKAAKMLSDFQANKDAAATEELVNEEEALKMLKSTAASTAVKEAFGKKSTEEIINILSSNISAIAKIEEAVNADRDALKKAAEEAEGANESEKILAALKAGKFETLRYTTAKALAEGTASDGVKASDIAGVTELEEKDVVSQTIADKDAEGNGVFIPTYIKGNNVYGVIYYVKKLEEADKSNVGSLLGAFAYSNAHVEVKSESDLEAASKELKVMERGDIESALGGLKNASKQLKAFSDARMKEVDDLMKALVKAAKDDSGFAIFNRLAASDFNKAQVFAASTQLSSIFAAASLYKRDLSNVAKHISYYK